MTLEITSNLRRTISYLEIDFLETILALHVMNFCRLLISVVCGGIGTFWSDNTLKMMVSFRTQRLKSHQNKLIGFLKIHPFFCMTLFVLIIKGINEGESEKMKMAWSASDLERGSVARQTSFRGVSRFMHCLMWLHRSDSMLTLKPGKRTKGDSFISSFICCCDDDRQIWRIIQTWKESVSIIVFPVCRIHRLRRGNHFI